jgi:hypothetical protein
MSNVRTSLTIAAPPARVWRVLTDFDAYPEWNTVIQRVRAEAHLGAPIRFAIKIEGLPPMPFAAKVSRCVEGRAFGWRGGAPLVPAVAWAEHYFLLEPSGDGTLVDHREDFHGALGLMMRGPMLDRVTRTYDGFNHALKARAES